MKASRLTTVLENLLDQPWAAFIWGAPGIGKSSIVRQIAERRRMPLIDIRASLLDPTDLRGIPMLQDGTAVWCPPSFLPKKSDKPGILFLDEINAAGGILGATVKLRNFVTDNGCHILDASGLRIEDPKALEAEINAWPGVVTVGLFAAPHRRRSQQRDRHDALHLLS